MNTAAIRILLVEDSASDADLLQQTLCRIGSDGFEFTWVERLGDALARLSEDAFDVLLLDLSLPDSSGPETYRRARDAAPATPIVVLTGAADERLGLTAVHEGVQDYLVKGEADGKQIARAIRYAIERKQAEEQLRQQREALAAAHAEVVKEKNRLQAVMESLPVGVSLVDAHGGNRQANPAFEQLWAGPPPTTYSFSDDAAYRACWAATGKAVQPQEWASARAVQKGETVVGQEMEIRRFDGTLAIVLNSAAPIRDEHGRIAGSAVAIMDITERKRAEDQIRRQNAVLAGINRIFREALTCDTEEQLGRSCLTVLQELTQSRFGFISEVNPEGRLDHIAISDPGWDACRMDRPAGHRNVPGFGIRGVYGRVILDGNGLLTNDVMSHPDSIGVPAGHPPLKAFLGAPLRHAAKTIGLIGLANRENGYRLQDLEAVETLAPAIVQVFLHKRAERERERLVEKLRESVADSNRNRAQLETVLQGMQDGVIVFDMQGQAVFVNDAESRIIGFPRAEATRQDLAHFASVYELRHMDGRPVPLAQWPGSRVLRGESFADWELRGMRRDDRREWVFSFSGEPVHDSDGKQILAVVITRDVTERKGAEERLRHAQKLESIGVLAGGVAHDFNNILTSIMGNASLAQLEAPEIGDRLSRIVEATERAAGLTGQLLAYAGKGRFKITNFELSRIIHSSSSLIRVSIPKHVELVMDVPDDLPLIRGDAEQIQQVAMNLVINAAEAIGTNERGTVSIRVAVADVGSNAPATPGFDLAPGRYVCLEVRDNGCGMDPATKAKIFDPFFTTKFTGRGLGLAAVQGILRAHKGAIAVESNPGEGSTFRVYLPCVAAGRSQKAPKDAEIDRRRAATVLVVDDERDVRTFVKAALERLGHTVLLADNGRQALETLRENSSIDLILLDVVMPVIGGGEALAEIRRRWPGVGVLITSGYNREEARRLAPIPGDLPFIEKPFTLQKLAAAIQKALDARPHPSPL